MEYMNITDKTYVSYSIPQWLPKMLGTHSIIV